MLLNSIKCPVLEIVLCSSYRMILQRFRQFWTFISFPMDVYHLWDSLKSIGCLNYYHLLRALFWSLKFFLDFTYYYFMYVKVCLNVCLCHVYALPTETRRGIGSPRLEYRLRATMWVLRIKPKTSLRADSAVNTGIALHILKSPFHYLHCTSKVFSKWNFAFKM